MPKSPLQKSLQEYISKMKKTPSSHFRIPSKSISRATKRFIRGCKHPKTISFALENTKKSESHHTSQNDKAATLDDIDQFLFDNFKSLYINDEDYDNESKSRPTYKPPRFIKPVPDFCWSRYFFEPTKSSSSMEDVGGKYNPRYDDVASSSSTTTSTTSSASASASAPAFASVVGDSFTKDSKQVMGPEDFITLLTYSPSPYDEFKQSMQEMADARLQHHGKVDWEFMEELLSCYMNLNDKKSYKYILRAFVDLVITLRENSGKVTARPRCSTTYMRN